MNILDEVLASPDAAPQHPVVRWLGDRIAAHDEITVELERDSSPLGSSITGLVILRQVNGVEQPPAPYKWDDDFNASLIDLGIKAVDLQQEGDRFARVLRAALRKVERRYGDGFLNAVLVDLIDESDLGQNGEIGKVRKLVHSNSPERGRSYNDCRDAIATEIGGRARELRDKLRYNPEQLKMVMDRAIAQYLDERFSITGLRRLGWIDQNGRTT